jgi:RimJ/RimL family protein N-acetyltransferase
VDLCDGDVTLRSWRTDDLDELVAAVNDPEIGRWMPAIPHPYTYADGRAYLARAAVRDGAFAVVDTESGRLLGGITVNAQNWGRAEIGYWVRADSRDRGVASRALTLVAAWGLNRYRRLQLHADVENRASQRVAEKAGFSREGVLRAWIEQNGSQRDHVLYSLLQGDPGSTRATPG